MKKREIAVSVILSIVTCNIYGIYWAYKMGQTMSVTQQKNRLPAKDNSVLYLVLQIIGLGIVNYILIQSDLNAIIDKQQGTPNGAM